MRTLATAVIISCIGIIGLLMTAHVSYAPYNPPHRTDYDLADMVGLDAKRAGLVTDYTVNAAAQYIDLNVGSLSSVDAHDVADGVCKFARTQSWDSLWTVRVFLVVGDRPAAECTTSWS